MFRIFIAGSEVFTIAPMWEDFYRLDGRFNACKGRKRSEPETVVIHAIGGWIAYHFTY